MGNIKYRVAPACCIVAHFPCQNYYAIFIKYIPGSRCSSPLSRIPNPLLILPFMFKIKGESV